MKILPRLLPILLGLLLSSCGIGFEKNWRAALQTSRADGSVDGPWEGTWHSVPTGHKGRLRCLVGIEKNGTGERDFVYRASWGKILSGTFTAVHQARKAGDTWVIEGRHELPDWAGGLYQYNGRIEKGVFKLDYRSPKDHGSFQMRRP